MDWNKWTRAFEKVCSEANIEGLHMMMTINALCLDTIVDFFDWMLEMKRKYGHNRPGFTCNILRFPSFQSPLTLPDHLRAKYHDEVFMWLQKVRRKQEKDADGQLLVQPWEQDQLSRLIEYLDVVKTPHRNTADRELLEHDFKLFYEQYDSRRGLNFRETFPNLVEFYDSIKLQDFNSDEQDIQAPKTAGVKGGLYAKRVVTEDGEVKVVEMKMRNRNTGESDDDYDDEKYADDEKKNKAGSSIGWDTETDGLGGATDD